jgi:hypothetical protein
MRRASTFVLSSLTLLALVACSDAAPPLPDQEPALGSVSLALEDTDPVSAAVDASCSTTSVKGLALQLVAEIQCNRPGSMTSIEGAAGLDLGEAVFPFLQTPAANALLVAQKARGKTMTINSALRTLPQQYLLYRWYKTGRCGISLAATPGTSNHEGALAVDLDDAQAWRPAMTDAGFHWLGASDPVHFDYVGPGSIELGGLSVTAFQHLWNVNHPEDPIGEDGDYGPETEKRVALAPVGGFPKGPEGCAGDASAPAPDASTPLAPDPARPSPEVVNPPTAPDDDGGGCSLARAPRGGGGAQAASIGLSMLALVMLARSRRPRRAPSARIPRA